MQFFYKMSLNNNNSVARKNNKIIVKMVQEEIDHTWASFSNALNRYRSLDSYIQLINILKTPLDYIKEEIGWNEKYGPIIEDLNALESSILLMITEIKSFAATASRYYDNIKEQLMIVYEIFKVSLLEFIDFIYSLKYCCGGRTGLHIK